MKVCLLNVLFVHTMLTESLLLLDKFDLVRYSLEGVVGFLYFFLCYMSYSI